MTRAASFFAGVTLLGVVAVSIGIGLLHSTLPDGGWSQIAYGAFFIGVGVIRLAAVLRAARTSRAEETPRRKSTTSSRSSSKSSAEFHSPPRHGAPPHSTTICRGEYLLAAATIHSIPTLNNESTNTRSGPTAGSLAPQKIQSTSKFSLSNEPSTLLICRWCAQSWFGCCRAWTKSCPRLSTTAAVTQDLQPRHQETLARPQILKSRSRLCADPHHHLVAKGRSIRCAKVSFRVAS
jgi:hypothetical protein